MAQEIAFILNGKEVRTALPAGTALVDFIREDQRLTGTRIGCREGDCGACTVLLGAIEHGQLRYRAVVSCLFPLADAAGCHVVTVEGLNRADLTPVQQALVSEGASQCGFCTPGIVVSLTGFLLADRELRDDDAVTAIEGNVCRCTGYTSICRALERVLRELRPKLLASPDRLQALVELGVLPGYFPAIPARLATLPATAPGAPAKDAVILAGGTDLYVQRGPVLPMAELRLLSRQEGFAAIWPDAERIFIGAAATVSDLMASPVLSAALPFLAGFLYRVSSMQVRNRATVGGNIVNASPIGDLSVLLLALDADIGLLLGDQARQMKLRDFFLGYKKLDLRPGEVAAWVSVPVKKDGRHFHFEKVARRRNQDIASVNAAIGLETAGERIVAAHAAAGGVAPVPLFLKAASALLAGKKVSPALVQEFIAAADRQIAPIDDVRGSAAYKRALLRRLLFAAFLELFPERVHAGDLP
jgi:xanthine dehydrogenase small subunit